MSRANMLHSIFVHLYAVETTLSQSGTYITTFPRLGFIAKAQERGRAWLAWTVARHFDSAGSGLISKLEIEKFAVSLGLTKREWRKMLDDALTSHFCLPVTRKRGRVEEEWILLYSTYRVAKQLGAENIGSRKAEILTDHLLGDDCWPYLWAAYLSTVGNQPMARSVMRTQTHVHEKTQQRYENRIAGVKRIPCYGVSQLPANKLAAYREFADKNGFAGKDHRDGKSKVMTRLPDKRLVDVLGIQPARRGVARRINKELRSAPWLKMEPGKGAAIRVFHDSEKTLRHAQHGIRKNQINGRSGDNPEQLYVAQPRNLYRHANPDVQLYDVVAAYGPR